MFKHYKGRRQLSFFGCCIRPQASNPSLSSLLQIRCMCRQTLELTLVIHGCEFELSSSFGCVKYSTRLKLASSRLVSFLVFCFKWLQIIVIEDANCLSAISVGSTHRGVHCVCLILCGQHLCRPHCNRLSLLGFGLVWCLKIQTNIRLGNWPASTSSLAFVFS